MNLRDQYAAVSRAQNQLIAAWDFCRKAQETLYQLEIEAPDYDVSHQAEIYRRELIAIKKRLDCFSEVFREIGHSLEDELDAGRPPLLERKKR